MTPETLRKLAEEISNVGHRWRTELDAAADAWEASIEAQLDARIEAGALARRLEASEQARQRAEVGAGRLERLIKRQAEIVDNLELVIELHDAAREQLCNTRQQLKDAALAPKDYPRPDEDGAL